jgi:hypothetical protein
VPHTETPLFGVDFFTRSSERVFCPHPSLTASFLKCSLSAINPANDSSNTHTPGSLTWSLTSLLHTLIHPHRSSHSLLPASFYVMLSKFGVLPVVKVILSATQAHLALSASPRFFYLFTAHSPQPYLQISFHQPISPVQHRALYKKIIMLLCTTCPWDPYTHLSAFLILFICSRPLACVAVHTLACSYHHHSFAAFLHSFTVFTLCIFSSYRSFRSFATSLSFLDWAEAEDICSAVLVLRNL